MTPPPGLRALRALRALVALPTMALAALGALIAVACSSAPGQTATAALASLGGSGVQGTATLTAADGGTEASIDVKGLPASRTARVVMRAGTCSAQSASTAPVADLQADAGGRALATGRILFRGTEKVPLATIADNDHVLVVEGPDRPLACGRISP